MWSPAIAHIPRDEVLERAKDDLQRRIKFSRSALLDVELYANRDWDSPTDLFDLVVNAGFERWKSLNLKHNRRSPPFTKDMVALTERSRFSSLRSLTVASPVPVMEGLFALISSLIVQSNPVLEEVYIYYAIPDIYLESKVLQHVKQLSANSEIIQKLHKLEVLSKLQELHVLNVIPYIDPANFPPLPAHSRIDALSRSQLAALITARVEVLYVRNWNGADSSSAIHFPVLRSLSLGGTLEDIRRLSAPKLETLEVRCKSKCSLDQEEANITTLFNATPSLILIKPSTLILKVTTKISGLVLVLETWSQIQDLSLLFSSNPSRSELSKELTRTENPLCPNLKSLKLDIISHEPDKKLDKWRDIARVMFVARRDLPLESIEWRFRVQIDGIRGIRTESDERKRLMRSDGNYFTSLG